MSEYQGNITARALVVASLADFNAHLATVAAALGVDAKPLGKAYTSLAGAATWDFPNMAVGLPHLLIDDSAAIVTQAEMWVGFSEVGDPDYLDRLMECYTAAAVRTFSGREGDGWLMSVTECDPNPPGLLKERQTTAQTTGVFVTVTLSELL